MTGPPPHGSAHQLEELQDVLDGRATPDVAARVRQHLASCDACRAALAVLSQARNAAVTLRVERELPASLHASIVDALDAEDATAGRPVRAHASGAWSWGRWGIAAAAVVALMVYVGIRPAGESLPSQAARDFLAVVDTASLPFDVRSDQASVIEALFADRTGSTAALRVRVIDLGMMQFQLEGGIRHRIGARPSALYAYRGPANARIVCQMFEGRLDELPPTSDVRENGGFRFHVYQEGDVAMVFWQEGDILCVLASRMPVDDLVALAFAKAMQPA